MKRKATSVETVEYVGNFFEANIQFINGELSCVNIEKYKGLDGTRRGFIQVRDIDQLADLQEMLRQLSGEIKDKELLND